MLPASNRGVGMNIGFPDVCMTPMGLAVVPIPYPNLGMNAMAIGFSPNVLLTGMNALNMVSKIMITMGDEGGVAHPMIKQLGSYVMGNPIVKVNYLPGICLCCPTTGNNFNNALGAALVPSLTNVFYTYAPGDRGPAGADPYARELDLGAVDALARELAPVGREGGPPVEASLIAPEIGYLAIRIFSRDVPSRAFLALADLAAQGARALVVDLRDNPGGELSAMVEVASDLLPEGAEIVTMIDAEGDETVFRARGESPCDLPMVILVNRGTASAAELLAGSLAAHGRAEIVGERTYGKGVGQGVVAGAGGRMSIATVARFRLPGGREIDGAGLRGSSPDE
jgi:carboxyl-terminal processing protease